VRGRPGTVRSHYGGQYSMQLLPGYLYGENVRSHIRLPALALFERFYPPRFWKLRNILTNGLSSVSSWRVIHRNLWWSHSRVQSSTLLFHPQKSCMPNTSTMRAATPSYEIEPLGSKSAGSARVPRRFSGVQGRRHGVTVRRALQRIVHHGQCLGPHY